MIDITIVRPYACATGYQKNTQAEQALGQVFGGPSTRAHALVDGLGCSLQVYPDNRGSEHASCQGAALLDRNGGAETALLVRGCDFDALI